jgi:hypothetical protein
MIPTTVLLATPEYVKHTTSINKSVDDDRLRVAIYLTQDTRLHPMLGTRLYEKFLADGRTNTIAGHYLDLLDNHIRRVVAWYAMLDLLPDLYSQIDNGGVVQRTGDGVNAVEKSILDLQISRARQYGNYYADRMIEHMRYYQQRYPEYSVAVNDELVPIVDIYRQNGMSWTGGGVPLRDRYPQFFA